MVPDAWFAALAIEHGCEWITEDRDYARFPGLRWRSLRNPSLQ
jgi:predicted nucleic acid-binding protein